MSSRKAQIKVNQNRNRLIDYVYGKTSTDEEAQIEDVLFENDNLAIVMDKLLSFVIRHDIKEKRLQQLFEIYHIMDLEGLERKIERIIFHSSVHETPPNPYREKISKLSTAVSVNWRNSLRFKGRFGKRGKDKLMQLALFSLLTLSFVNLELSSTNSTPTPSKTIVSCAINFLDVDANLIFWNYIPEH